MPPLAAVTAAKPPSSRIAKIERGRLRDPLRFVIYGGEGVGKTSLAADAPVPLFLDVEDGSGKLDVSRYPFRDGPGGHVPASYKDVLAAIDDLTANEGPYRTLIIDTADRLEALVWQHMIERDKGTTKGGLTNIESYGYGKGYIAAVDEWRALALRLDRLRMARGMSVVLLAHSQIRPFKNPLADDYDRYVMRIHDKAAGFLKEWADVVGFACFEDGTAAGSGDRARGFTTGRRLLKLERTAAYDAKVRGLALPPEVELTVEHPWAPLGRAIEEAAGLTIEQLEAAINAECARIGDAETTAKVAASVTEAKGKSDSVALHRYLVALRSRPSIITPKEEA